MYILVINIICTWLKKVCPLLNSSSVLCIFCIHHHHNHCNLFKTHKFIHFFWEINLFFTYLNYQIPCIHFYLDTCFKVFFLNNMLLTSLWYTHLLFTYRSSGKFTHSVTIVISASEYSETCKTCFGGFIVFEHLNISSLTV